MTSTFSTDLTALLLRLGSGVLFLAHGLMKVFTFTIPGTVAYFESLGLPGAFAYLTILAELGGGLLLLSGLATRLVSLPLVLVLLGATWVHSGNGWTFSNANGGWEFPLFWALVQATIGILGAGAYRLRVPALQRALGAFA
ncbi:DoxX family protein [Rhodobacter maris]|uniref:Putative oxidoreductase n=1 Tax=Rhodobacter maris TaxID=446682 RepID=A0A285T3Z2_9RHOB|nr:DoxX family protein [Rhodobacter maris]SOC15993.1 putative oxidoreductase [Rhodobacter maris]